MQVVVKTTVCLLYITGAEEGGDSIQYEVLHQTDGGMYLIQPTSSTPISLSGMAMGTDHIIVHTLPVSNLLSI